MYEISRKAKRNVIFNHSLSHTQKFIYIRERGRDRIHHRILDFTDKRKPEKYICI